MRVTVLERTISHGPAGQPSPRLSLKVEYVDNAEARKPGMGSLCQNVEALERCFLVLLFINPTCFLKPALPLYA